MSHNPFPGPQPYRSSDRDRFYGREEMSYRLDRSLLAHRCVTVYGPSGAGKSSLIQASVIPSLIESEGIAVVRVDGWPPDADPTRWLADSMYGDLSLGERPADLDADQAIRAAVQRMARRSSKLMLLYLDQIEQLLYPGRDTAEVEAFFDSLGGVVDLPLRNLRVLLALREDYLGRFRDRLRDHRRLLDHGFRVGPLTVAEISEAVCQAAAAGEPPQSWALDRTTQLMLQVRVPGQAAAPEAEAQAAYAQIVCRALFEQRARSGGLSGDIEAEAVLRDYLETTIGSLGPLGSAAQRLLEDHLVTADGSRTLRTEKELLRVIPEKELSPILKALEGAAILHAEEHQGSRYFEIGHDWLARRVFEQRQQRERDEEARAKLAKDRTLRRRLAAVAIVSLAIATGMGALTLRAVQEKRAADEARLLALQREEEAKQAQKDAEAQKSRAEALQQEAEKEKLRAEAEAKRAREAAEEARRAGDEARRSEESARTSESEARTAESLARTAEARALEQEKKATQSAEEERRSRLELEKLIQRAAGTIREDLK